MRIFLRLLFLQALALLAVSAITPSYAQGTSEQREACEGDAHRLCDAYIPDAIAVEKCLRANSGKLSRGCRAEFRGGKRRR